MYTTNHKMLLQAIINEGAIFDEKLKELSFTLFPQVDVATLVFQINEQLNSVNMMVKASSCDITGEKYWCIISYASPTIDKAHIPYKQNNLTFLRAVFCEIITSGIGCVSSTKALNLMQKMDFKLTKIESNEFIKELILKKWLSTKEGYYFIGPRSAAELSSYFKENFADLIFDCDLCRQVVFYGKICPECTRKSHYKCLHSFAASVQGHIKCPSCDHRFDSIEDNLEDVIDQYQVEHNTMNDQTMATQSQVVEIQSQSQESDEESMENQHSQPTVSQRPQRSQKSRTNRKYVADDSD